MKKKGYVFAIGIVVIWLCFGLSLSAQVLRTGYFMEGYPFRHLMNPALKVESNYVSIPVLGNLYVETRGNVGLNNFLYPYDDGQLTTFMNRRVDADDFLKGLKRNNRIGADLNVTLFAAGFQAWGGFNTVDISVRSSVDANLPRGLFEFMKLGMYEKQVSYEMGGLSLASDNYVQLALGHSRQLGETLRVGGKLKVLLGAGSARVKVDNMVVQLAEDKWMVRAEGDMLVSVKGMQVATKSETGKVASNAPEADLVDWGSWKIAGAGLAGAGVAADFGVAYDWGDNFTVSASVLDLGFVSWRHTVCAATSNEPWLFDGFHDIAMTDNDADGDKPLEVQLEELGQDIEKYVSFHRTETAASRIGMLGATVNLGVDYVFPLYDKLHFGLLSTMRIHGEYGWSEGRISANVFPLKWLDAGISCGFSTFGTSVGWILNFHPRRLNFFIGMDCLPGRITPQGIPVGKANTGISFGCNVLLGK